MRRQLHGAHRFEYNVCDAKSSHLVNGVACHPRAPAYGASCGKSTGVTEIDDHWVKQLRRGIRFLFWAILISVPLTTLGAMAVPFLGGTRSNLRWITLVWTLAELLLLIGVHTLSEPVACPEEIRVTDAPRRLLRICTVLAFLGQVGRLVASHIQSWPRVPYVLVGERLAESIAIFCLFLYLRRLGQRFDQLRLCRSLGLMAWVAAIANVLRIFSLGGMYREFGLSLSTYNALLWSRLSVDFVVWIWALRLLWKCGTRIPVAAEGRCINCGYTREGLTDPRCPECGLAFDLGSADTDTHTRG